VISEFLHGRLIEPTHDWRERLARGGRKPRRRWTRSLQALPLALGPVLVLHHTPWRQWFVEAHILVCVVGGFLAAPVVSLVAWVGILLPPRIFLHQLAPTLFAIALVWVALGLISAHAHDIRHAGARE
jgi:hypothetical protein